MWFILLCALSEALILLLESVVNFSGRDIFSEEIDHNVLFHATSCSLITLATPIQGRREGGGCGSTLKVPGHI
jgi:hypothetical protein